MNQEKFKQFSEAYRAGLEEAARVDPDYFLDGKSPEEFASIVSARMLAKIGSGGHMGVNYDGGGFRRACKKLGISFSRRAILAYLEIKP